MRALGLEEGSVGGIVAEVAFVLTSAFGFVVLILVAIFGGGE